jgi:hypothetical protein
MNALVRKEIRLVLPAWIAAVVLAIFPVWLVWPGPHSFILQSPGVAVYAPFAIGVLLLGLTPFGQELNFGTFSMLLAQPVSRRHLWLVKTTVLATALGLVFAALCFSNHIRVESVLKTSQTSEWQKIFERPATAAQLLKLIAETRHDVLHDSLLIGGLCALAAFASGLWTNLLLRNTSAAFWFSLLVPLGLGLVAGKLFGGFSQGIADAGLIAALGIYSAAGFLWAKKFFLRVQDTQWTGGILSLPTALGAKAASPARNRKPFRALIRKEYQLHQMNLLIAGLLLLSHVVVIIVRRVSADYFMTHRSVAMIWESWPMLWLAMPLLIGGVAVAEERKLGTLENFLCLPTPRRREFAVKLFMAMLLGVFLGGVMPLAIEWLGTLAGLSRNIFDASMTFNWKTVSLISELMAGSAGLTFLALYASTLTRNLLQALGLALVLTVFAGGVFAIAESVMRAEFDLAPLWRGPLIGCIGWPVMIVTILALAYGNFKQLHVGWKIWRRNFVVLLASLAGVAAVTTVVYHRAWELWVPEEPSHRYYGMNYQESEKRLATTPKISASLSRIATIIPRGRLWLRQGSMVTIEKEFQGHAFSVFRATGPWHEGFVAGSNWRDVAISQSSCYAIQADGSLWDLSEVQPEKNGAAFGPKPFGAGRDWKSISGSWEHFVALKSDGTLWEWKRKFKISDKTFAGEQIPIPTQVGNDTDWIAAGDFGPTSVAMKSDGSIWRFGVLHTIHTNSSSSSKTVQQPERWLSFERRDPVSMSFDGQALVVTCKDGTLWIGGTLPIGLVESSATRRAVHEMVRWGNDSDWREVKFELNVWGGAIGIKRGGSLWEWNRDMGRFGMDWVIQPTMQSHYFDWVAACPYNNGSFLALNADGNLCLWGDSRSRGFNSYYWSDPSLLLQPSRIKARTIAELHR